MKNQKQTIRKIVNFLNNPDDPALWQLDRFEDFIEARKALLRNRFASLLVPTTTA